MTRWARIVTVLRDQRGNLQFGGGSQKQQQMESRAIAAPSAQEQALTAANLRLAQQQITQQEAAMQQQQAYASGPQAAQDAELQRLATANLIARLNGTAPVLNPQQQAMLDSAFASTNRQGMEDLTRFAQEQAAQRGMTTADSPIGAEALRQARLFQADLASRKSQSALDLSQTGANFNASIKQFQDQLAQQAVQNRLALASNTPASYGLQQNLFAQRLAAAPRSMSGVGTSGQSGYGLSGQDVGSLASGLGGLMRGYASMNSSPSVYNSLYGYP